MIQFYMNYQADRIVINRGDRVLDALPRHEDLARSLGM